ncbi:hypothetical protein MTQ00_09285 [Chryseobacterium sp. B21-037]|uniref:hypothetical protein n=1 Tax=Chryseobacterium sp. B21-037 TaxID=2926038 RepID=UPI002358DB82|nr:hypothetical protein [Chryseobacterium sp. B21-037]MDC8104732.1 hypothetical protein [Chryseobacterium sp. B21-037]
MGHPFRSGTCISRGVDDISRSVSGVGYYTWRTGGKKYRCVIKNLHPEYRLLNPEERN